MTIESTLQHIEAKKHVAILYACEAGSWAWGFASQDSDYDIRFIYVHPLDWYLSIEDHRDVIELPIVDRFDFCGWELRKALRLFRKSNPPLLEWLNSPTVYLECSALASELRGLMGDIYSPNACLYHYYHIAKGNYRDYLQGDKVWTKKYLYVLRPLLACRWIEQGGGTVPVEFGKLVESVSPEGIVRQQIQILLARKLDGNELGYAPANEVLNRFIESELRRLKDLLGTLPQIKPEAGRLDTLFRRIVTGDGMTGGNE